jgi:hypothetical protein
MLRACALKRIVKVGTNTYHMLSSPTITVIGPVLVLRWYYLKHYMGKSAKHLYFGTKLEKERYFGLEVFKEAKELGLGIPKLLEDSSA